MGFKLVVFATLSLVLLYDVTCVDVGYVIRFMQHEKQRNLVSQIDVDTDQVLSVTEQEYLSICLDPYLKHDIPDKPWQNLNFSNPKVHTLAKGLAPAILRFGGTDADWSYFYNVTSKQEQDEIWRLSKNMLPKPAFVNPFFPQDIDNLHQLARDMNGSLLYDLNIQVRFGRHWDPNNALLLMQYIQQQGYAEDMAFELGNEPNYPDLTISGTQIGEDSLSLKNLLSQLKGFENTRVVGPDIGISTSGFGIQIAKDFARTVKKNITALTVHQYYFRGPGSHLSQFVDVKNFDHFEEEIVAWRDAMWEAAGEQLDVWVGETSDAFNYGAHNITDRYVSGLLWMDKLGLASRNKYKLVARQDFYGGSYPLIGNDSNPNPDYWLSHVFKQLVGREVFPVKVSGVAQTKGQLLRVYAHCTTPRGHYPSGSVTVYLVNIKAGPPTEIKFNPNMYGATGDFYEMLPEGGDILSRVVKLNGKEMKLVDDHTLPKLNPVEVKLTESLKLQQFSYSFVVLKEAKAKACMD